MSIAEDDEYCTDDVVRDMVRLGAAARFDFLEDGVLMVSM